MDIFVLTAHVTECLVLFCSKALQFQMFESG